MLLYLIRQWSRRARQVAPVSRPPRNTWLSRMHHRSATYLNRVVALLNPLQQRIAVLIFLLIGACFFMFNMVRGISGRTRGIIPPARLITPSIQRHGDTASPETIWRQLQLSKDSNHFKQQHDDSTKALRKK